MLEPNVCLSNEVHKIQQQFFAEQINVKHLSVSLLIQSVF